MRDWKRALESLGLPDRDSYDLAPSQLTFPDGCHYRVEIAGVERASAFEAMMDEAVKRDLPIHRVIATVGGATYLDKHELRRLAELAAAAKVEVIITLGPRRAWDCGRQIVTVEGLVSGMRVRGSDNMLYLLRDMDRCLEAGFRGFLVTDEGMLFVYDSLRKEGIIPRETVFKVSVFAGHGNAAGALLLERLGANSFNPLADLTLPMLASIRKAVRIPVDVYVILVEAMGGFNRFHEAPDIVRVCSPCYLKFEPGPSEAHIYAPWNTESFHEHMIRAKVRYASIVREIIHQYGPGLKLSAHGAADLAIPVV